MQGGDARAAYLAADQMRAGREDAAAYNDAWASQNANGPTAAPIANGYGGYAGDDLARAGYPRNAMFIDTPTDRNGDAIQGVAPAAQDGVVTIKGLKSTLYMGGAGNPIETWVRPDGVIQNYADGYSKTDLDGNTVFTGANMTGLGFQLSEDDYNYAQSRAVSINWKTDAPGTWHDIKAGIDGVFGITPLPVRTADQQTELTALQGITSAYVGMVTEPERYSPALQELDHIRSSVNASAMFLTAKALDVDPAKRQALVAMSHAASDVATARAAALTFTGGRAPTLVENNAGGAVNPGNAARYNTVLGVAESANPLIESLNATGKLPQNYMTKAEAVQNGWQPGKALGNSVPGGQIGGDRFFNDDGVLPSQYGRVWYEADIGLDSSMTRTKQQGTRLLYSNDGLSYITTDHYVTVHPVAPWKGN